MLKYMWSGYMDKVPCSSKGHVKAVDRHKPRGLGVKRIEPCPWTYQEEVPVLPFEKTGVEALAFKPVSVLMTIAPGRKKGCQNVLFI